ncbi:NAD(P)-binding protein [Mycena metata]|uniref:NAD(P)-binding protein n=1 Tax=Mycena metata TaxID=1033252 RepID=A0AAD7K702_9AGAR|nr:NAD(P)-binding protein [Mycena metata]
MPISFNPTAPLVVVVGSTGNQGGSVIKALTESDRPYRIRGLTRDATRPVAQRLTTQGVEVVNVSLTIENADAVTAAFAGASIAFIVTNFWEHRNREREVAEGKMMVKAAMDARVSLVVWSTLESISQISNGKYTHVDHFEGKAEVTAYARQLGCPLLTVQAGAYSTNHMQWKPFMQKRQEDGSYVLDFGLFVRGGIESPALGVGAEILTCGEEISVGEMAAQLSHITGKKVTYKRITDEEFMAATEAPYEVALELLEMMKFFDEFGYYAGKGTKPSREYLSRVPQTWGEFVRENDWSSVLACMIAIQ